MIKRKTTGRKPGRKARKDRKQEAENRPDRKHGRSPASRPWLFGRHAVLAALSNPARRCLRLVVCAAPDTALEDELNKASAQSGRDLPAAEQIDRNDLAALLGPGAVHQGIALLVEPLPETALETVLGASSENDRALIVVLDQATDPRNVGAVMRSAAAFGALAVVVQTKHAPEATGVLAKAAAGTLETVPLVRVVNISRAMAAMKNAGFWILGLNGDARQTLEQAGMSGKTALVLGSEGGGLRRLVAEKCDLLARIPMDKKVESLNLSVASAIALYELTRNRA